MSDEALFGLNPPNQPDWLDAENYGFLMDACSSTYACGAPWGKEGCGDTEDLTIDHVVPRYDGGTNVYTNLQILCRPCNSRKGTRPSEYWRRDDIYWDRLPDDAGFAKLRPAQRDLFNEIAHEQSRWFGEHLIGEISGHLYTNIWVVGAGKTLGIPVTAWALNQVIREHWGAARRVDRPLIIVKDTALRSQIAKSLREDLVRYGIVRTAPKVAEIERGVQFRQRAWIDSFDALVVCEQHLWEAVGSARPDREAILAMFPLIVFDEPHFAPDQIRNIVRAARASVCVGFTSTPIDLDVNLLEDIVRLTTYDYQEAAYTDRSLKYLDDSEDRFSGFVRQVDINYAEKLERGTYGTTDSARSDGYSKQIEPAKAVARGVIEEVSQLDRIEIEPEDKATHRIGPDFEVSFSYPAHAIIFVGSIAEAEALTGNTQKYFGDHREMFPQRLGWNACTAHSGNKQHVARPLARKPGEDPHPWKRYWETEVLDAQCARVMFAVDQAREGLDNPPCALVGVAVESYSVLEAIQAWLGRQLRSVTKNRGDGVLRVPPAMLDTVRIVTHSAYDVMETIKRAIEYTTNMKSAVSALPTIAALSSGQAFPDPEEIQGQIEFPFAKQITISCEFGERMAEGNPITLDELQRKYAPGGGRKAERIQDLFESLSSDPVSARKRLNLGKKIKDIIIVTREDIRHAPTDTELERFVKIHYRDDPDIVAELPVSDANRHLLRALHKSNQRLFQQPALTVGTRRDDAGREVPVTINWLVRRHIGGGASLAVGTRRVSDPHALWRLATSAAARKLGVPPDARLADGGDYDIPQAHAIVQRPEVIRELVAWVITRLVDDGLCPALGYLRIQGDNDDIA